MSRSTDRPRRPDAESHSAADAQAERQGLPWEREGGGQLAAAVETLRLVLTEPARAFRMMRQVGGLGDPTLYVAVLGTVGTFFALIWRSMFEGWTASMMGDELAAFTDAGGIGMWSLVLAPFMMVVLTAIGALIYHLALLLFSGAPQPLETTYRVVAYVWGSTSLIQIVPMCGGIIAFVWGSVVMIIGIREAHGVPQSRAPGRGARARGRGLPLRLLPLQRVHRHSAGRRADHLNAAPTGFATQGLDSRRDLS